MAKVNPFYSDGNSANWFVGLWRGGYARNREESHKYLLDVAANTLGTTVETSSDAKRKTLNCQLPFVRADG
jgi:hypothetical protein